eukprot:SAG22_NODE_157_length_16986_cov_17.230177_11_plen_77_part_00
MARCCDNKPETQCPFHGNGTTSGAGWTQPALREFLEYLDKKGVTRVDIWTGDALIPVQAVAICDFFIDELRRWRLK